MCDAMPFWKGQEMKRSYYSCGFLHKQCGDSSMEIKVLTLTSGGFGATSCISYGESARLVGNFISKNDDFIPESDGWFYTN